MNKVSIILPNYNHEKFLQKRIDSILDQSYQNFELIILDDASTDGSLQILERYKNNSKVTHFEINTTNSGSPFAQWKKGIDIAKGDLIWIAESDDFCTNNFLQETVTFLENNKKASLVFVKTKTINLFTNTDIVIEPHKNTGLYSNISENFLFNWFFENSPFKILNASSCLFRAEVINTEILNKITTFRYAGDKLFWASIILKHDFFGFINKTINFQPYHNQTTRTRQSLKINTKRNDEVLYIYKYSKFIDSKSVSSGWRTELGSRLLLSFLYDFFAFKNLRLKNLIKGLSISKYNKKAYYKTYRGIATLIKRIAKQIVNYRKCFKKN